MNVEAQRAHERLLESTPRDRIRTNYQTFRDPVSPRKGISGGVPEEVRQHRRQVVRERVGKLNPFTGDTWRYDDIAAELGISKAAVSRYARVTGVAPRINAGRACKPRPAE